MASETKVSVPLTRFITLCVKRCGTYKKRQNVTILNNILHKIRRLQLIFPKFLVLFQFASYWNLLQFSEYSSSCLIYILEDSFEGETVLKMSFVSAGITNFWFVLLAQKATTGGWLWSTDKFHCLKSVQIRARKNSVFGHFSHSVWRIFFNKLGHSVTSSFYLFA